MPEDIVGMDIARFIQNIFILWEEAHPEHKDIKSVELSEVLDWSVNELRKHQIMVNTDEREEVQRVS